MVDGAARDIPEAIEAGLAIHARAAVAVTARGRVVERSRAVPIAGRGRQFGRPADDLDPGQVVVLDSQSRLDATVRGDPLQRHNAWLAIGLVTKPARASHRT